MFCRSSKINPSSVRNSWGTREKTIEIAINLLKNNMTIDFIEKTTGLSSSEIEKLRENIEDYKVWQVEFRYSESILSKLLKKSSNFWA